MYALILRPDCTEDFFDDNYSYGTNKNICGGICHTTGEESSEAYWTNVVEKGRRQYDYLTDWTLNKEVCLALKVYPV